MDNELKPCPFCGNSNQNVFSIINRKYKKYSIHCWRCGTDGPPRATESEAVAVWNKRVTEVKV